ncbi:GNAT family acetyltransferase [Bacillus cereus Rock3-42]|uniref:GNAT family N-acetyltransferase n=1 Tax=Bacillus cereus group TaxID=86661 RepID=UPI0001A0B4F6|nr:MULTISPECIES: GNAT family N-acetyltransferase [Bacillus cereus group]EEL46304.1 GNAT family acetyltransferase [Bacillus cereus Rock3-42]AXO97711.1 GNAT family N-acetyltransferase [Bacillus anthracis]MDQ4481142.1 GNAT family N-acetyltransferase [Bacillus cereus]MEB9457813.1 GNAT family N-acetyltransferase [Bacillus anthracis]OJD83599.1 acetyltransferase [Bacillus anthracis]
MNVVIERISKEAIPKSLLLLADPSEQQIGAYVRRGVTYVAKQDDNVIGVYVILETRLKTMEIMNIAVVEHLQGKGIGKKLLEHAVETAKENGMSKLEVGTGNSSVSQLALYQKCGFRIFSIDFDYFSKHYEEEIIENGIVCRDMIRLAMELNENV